MKLTLYEERDNSLLGQGHCLVEKLVPFTEKDTRKTLTENKVIDQVIFTGDISTPPPTSN